MGSLASLLMIYMPTCEILQLLKSLIQDSEQMKFKSPEKRVRLRWHIPSDAQDHTQLISTFIEAYMDIKMDKKKKQKTILEKCYDLKVNFD